MPPRPSALPLAALLLATTLPIAANAGDWRLVRVRSIAPRAAIDPVVNFDCAPERPGLPDAPVMVVTFRVGKGQQWRAVDMAPGQAIAVGDELRLNLADCRVEGPAPAAAASAP